VLAHFCRDGGVPANVTCLASWRLQFDTAAALRKQIVDTSAAMQGRCSQCPRARSCSNAPAFFSIDLQGPRISFQRIEMRSARIMDALGCVVSTLPASRVCTSLTSHVKKAVRWREDHRMERSRSFPFATATCFKLRRTVRLLACVH
jgi:hypothetical protein